MDEAKRGMIEVAHCGECPLHHTMLDSGGALIETCIASLARRIWPDEPERPEWCPLERGPITIRLAGPREAAEGER